MRRFNLVRDRDVSGVSGCGIVAEGIRFSDGAVALRWPSTTPSTVLYGCIADVMAVHLHGGMTNLVWIDKDEEIP